MQFHKIHSCGNDFIVFGSPSSIFVPDRELIVGICDRHFGIGADCVICITKSIGHDFFMHVYNPDGFEAEICGNALKCSGKYISDCGYLKKKIYSCETRSGERMITINGDDITAEIGKPEISDRGTLEVAGVHFSFVSVNLGNPHCVVFVNGLRDDEFRFFGSEIEKHPIFPEGTNVEFASIRDDNKILMRVWERGIGETLSCVTGSCACVAAAMTDRENCGNSFSVVQAGGIIDINVRDDGCMYTTGKCETVFRGTLDK